MFGWPVHSCGNTSWKGLELARLLERLPHLPALHAVASEAHLPAVLREHADVVGVEIAAGDIYVVGLVETTRHKI
jgi:hypothetical protein